MHKTLYLIRHGVIQSNLEDIYAGRSSEGLTADGGARAEQLGGETGQWGIQAIYCSPLQRALQTAQVLNRYWRTELVLDDDLNELDLGKWTGLSKAQVYARYPAQYRTWISNPAQFREDGMESLVQVRQRVLRSANRFVRGEQPQIAAFVTHAVAVKLLVLHYRQLPMDLYHKVEAPNLCVYRVVVDGQDGASVERLK
jgi:probable phosphoglycerate mutase